MAKFCTNCGAPVEAGEAFCRSCGARIGGAVVGTGAEQPAAQVSPAQPAAQYTQVPPAQPQAAGQYTQASPAQSAEQPYYQIPPAPPKKKRHLGCLIVFLVLFALFIGAVLFVYFGYIRNPNIPPIDPPSLLDEFFSELEEELSDLSDGVTLPDDYTLPDDIPQSETEGRVADLQVGAPADYRTNCQNDPGVNTAGTLTLESCTREPVSAEILAFGAENGMALDGYERCILRFSAEFTDVNAKDCGVNAVAVLGDAANAAQFDASGEALVDSYDTDYVRYKVSAGDGTAFVYSWNSEEWTQTADGWKLSAQRTLLLPAGYDGLFCGYRDGGQPEDMLIYRIK